MTRRVYVATHYAGHARAAEVASRLRRLGCHVVSTWHDGAELPNDGTDPVRRREICTRNVNDLRAADTAVVLAEDDRAAAAARGTLIEFALAWAWGHRVLVVGRRLDLTLMADLPGAKFVADLASAEELLR